MNCTHCGKDVREGSNFCELCGSKIEVSQDQDNQPETTYKNPVESPFSKNIIPCKEGVYRWAYGMNMWKNPTILITLWKVFFIGGMFPVLLVTILELFEQGIVEAVSVFIPFFLGMCGVITIVSVVAYSITALINGGSYQVVFELDDEGINHMQMQKQFKKNQVISMITVLAGIAAASPGTAGAGLLAACKQSSYSEFKNVKKIVAKPHRHVIYVNENLDHNQVYVNKEDFLKVKEFIVERCEGAKVVE